MSKIYLGNRKVLILEGLLVGACRCAVSCCHFYMKEINTWQGYCLGYVGVQGDGVNLEVVTVSFNYHLGYILEMFEVVIW